MKLKLKWSMHKCQLDYYPMKSINMTNLALHLTLLYFYSHTFYAYTVTVLFQSLNDSWYLNSKKYFPHSVWHTWWRFTIQTHNGKTTQISFLCHTSEWTHKQMGHTEGQRVATQVQKSHVTCMLGMGYLLVEAQVMTSLANKGQISQIKHLQKS